MPTDDQALMALQDLLSDDFQSKKSNSLQRKGEDKKDETFQLIQKIHNQLQQVQCDLIFKSSIRCISMNSNSANSRQVLQSISNSTNEN